MLRANSIVQTSSSSSLSQGEDGNILPGAFKVEVELVRKEEHYLAIIGGAERPFQDEDLMREVASETWEVRVLLISDAKNSMAGHVKSRSVVHVRPPVWEVEALNGRVWTIAINWGIEGT